MTREQMAGFFFGIGVGTLIGYFLQNDEHKRSPKPDPFRLRGERPGGPVRVSVPRKEEPRPSLAM